jgi:hypothetical protein
VTTQEKGRQHQNQAARIVAGFRISRIHAVGSKAEPKVHDGAKFLLAHVFLLDKRRAPGKQFGGQITKKGPHGVLGAQNSLELRQAWQRAV